MLIILTGPSCIGKTTAIQKLICELEFETITPYTTRPRRGESDGRFLAFISHEEFREMVDDFTGTYWVQPINKDYYGYKQKEIDEKIVDETKRYVIEAHSTIAFAIQKKHKRHCYLIYLDFNSPQELEKRIRRRFRSEDEIERRLHHATAERDLSHRYLHIIKNDDVSKLHERLILLVEECVINYEVRCAIHNGGISGPLLANDVKEMLLTGEIKIFEGEAQSEDQKTYELIVKENLKDDLLELSLGRFYRKPSKDYKKIFDLARNNNSDYERVFKRGKISPDGLTLQPGEFIIGQTSEKLEMPDNLFAKLVGRMSYALLGISIDFSADVLQPRHSNVIPLQIKNNNPFPIVIYPGTKLLQVVFSRTLLGSESNNGKERKTFSGNLVSTWDLDDLYQDREILGPSKSKDDSQRLGHWIGLSGSIGSLVGGVVSAIAFPPTIIVFVIFFIVMIYVFLKARTGRRF